MATAINVTCPECERPMKVPAEARGKKVRCKGCQHVFSIPGGPAKAAAKPAKPAKPPKPQARPDDDDEGDGKPYGVTTLDLASRCPTCANEIEEGAKVCLHCGYDTVTRTYHRTRKVHDTTGGDVFLWLLPGILCVIVILGLIGLDIWYCLCMKEVMAGSDYFEWLGGQACCMWTCIASLFGMFHAGRFAVKRLILHPKPPEVEKS
jgi:ribosomal protein S27E